jgi:hypothetical protein
VPPGGFGFSGLGSAAGISGLILIPQKNRHASAPKEVTLGAASK